MNAQYVNNRNLLATNCKHLTHARWHESINDIWTNRTNASLEATILKGQRSCIYQWHFSKVNIPKETRLAVEEVLQRGKQ